MWSVTKLTITIVFLGIKLSSVCSSIHFDEVEFYDPNKTLDESTSNGFICAHLGEECQISAQCCGVATCALPSWSDSPVCLIPGYKHDDRFRNRFLSLHNLRPEDIRYIRDSYNTSQYDFLLTDLTFSAPPLDENRNISSEITERNVTENNETVYVSELDGNHSMESTIAENEAGNTQNINISSVETEGQKLVKDLNSSLIVDSTNEDISITQSMNSSCIDKFDLKSHFMFLLIKNTLQQQSGSEQNLNDFYDQILNTDRFKKIVEQLKEKMRAINEIEKFNSDNKTESQTVINKSREINMTTTKGPQTIQKISKWNVIKKFFLRKKEVVGNNYNNSENKEHTTHFKELVNEISSKQLQERNHLENVETIIRTDSSSSARDNDGFKKLMEEVDEIKEIIDSRNIMNTMLEPKSVSDDDSFDFYNINVPLSSFNGISQKSETINNTLDGVFKDIGETISSMLTIKDNDKLKYVQQIPEIKEKIEGNNPQPDSEQRLENQSTIDVDGGKSKETHFWNKIHLWRASQNLSADVEKRIKNLFSRKVESSTTEKEHELQPLNEFFLLNLNSKNTAERATESQTEKVEQMSYPSSSSLESGSVSVEELYNNSYVFLVHKDEFEDPVKLSGWKKVLNLFHRENTVPHSSFDVRTNGIQGETPCDPETQIYNEKPEINPNSVDVPRIIRLPEYLMPQALDERQSNKTDWIFEDSDDLEDRITEEHKSSNSFLFLF